MERIKTRVEHEVDTRSVRLAATLIRLTKGRMARLWRRQVLLLTTRGRKSARERTVPLQFFPDGDDMIVVAANSGLPAPPGWYFNLTADPRARVEVEDRTVQVRAQELSDEEAAAFWPRVLQVAPDYAKYPRRTSRRIPLIRLVPATPTAPVTAAKSSARMLRNAGRQSMEIAPGVYWLRTGRAIAESNVYLVHSGSSWALIDTSWPNRAPLIKEAAQKLFGTDARPAAILLTHIHLDHVGSALELARTWDCPVYVHPDELPFAAPDLPTIERYANPLDRRVILPLLRAMPRRRAGSVSSKPGLKDVTRALDPLGSVPGLADWECIPTPGHTPGHVSFFRKSDRVLIAGDALSTVNLNSLRGFVLQKQKLSGPPYITTWNWRAAKDSVGALAKIEPHVIAGGHGVPMAAGPETARNLRAFADRFSGHAAATGERDGSGG
jgi:deazaflavin-dependent oxidoreductase (nitroreductase family)